MPARIALAYDGPAFVHNIVTALGVAGYDVIAFADSMSALTALEAVHHSPYSTRANHHQRLIKTQQRLLRDTAITTATNLAGPPIDPAAGRRFLCVPSN